MFPNFYVRSFQIEIFKIPISIGENNPLSLQDVRPIYIAKIVHTNIMKMTFLKSMGTTWLKYFEDGVTADYKKN